MTVVRSVLQHLPGKLPLATVPNDTNLRAAAESVLKAFPQFEAHHFTEDAIWRDSFGLTGTFRTFYSGAKVAKIWGRLSSQHGTSDATVLQNSAMIMRVSESTAWIDCSFKFSTTNPATECSGSVSLVPSEDGTWKIWVLKTILEQLSGQGNVDELQTPSPNGVKDLNTTGLGDHAVAGHSEVQTNGTTNGNLQNGVNDAKEETEQHFQCIVLGGGQAGLSVGGRLQALGVDYVILEKRERVGDAWRQRYQSARLHTIREFSHLPFDRTFGPENEEYIGKDALGDGHQDWAKRYNINIWNSTIVESGHWDNKTQIYSLKVRKDGALVAISAPHIVFATGAGSQTPILPDLPGKERFQGKVLHSAEYTNAEEWAGKTGIVVGTANTGHDVADDMLESGMAVTMVQRGRTFVLPVEYIEGQYRLMYNEKIPTEISDRSMMAGPMSISRLMASSYFHSMARAQPERWSALEKAGFKVDPFGDIMEVLNVRLGGHYIDIGTSTKITQGLIKVKSNALATAYTENGLAFSDGTEVKADVIVFATGFVGNMRLHVEEIFGKEVGETAGDCFGLNEEGEVLGAFKPLKQPGLWYIGGSLGMARFYSRFIALSVKATEIGKPLPVYTDNQHKIWV